MIPWKSVGWKSRPLMILGLDPEKANIKSEGTGQKSSDGKVSGFVILSKKEVFSKKVSE